TRFSRDWSSDVCSSDLPWLLAAVVRAGGDRPGHRRAADGARAAAYPEEPEMSTPPPPPLDTRARNRNRLALVAVSAVFVLPILIAMWIARADRIRGATGVHGEMYDPARDLRAVTLEPGDGSTYAWAPETRTWRILVVAPANCAQACVDLVADLDKVWRLFGRNAGRVHVL